MSETLRIGGRWAHEIAPYGYTKPVWETRAQGGCGDASFTLHLPPTAMPVGVRKGALVEIMHGAERKYMGRIHSIDRSTWAVTAKGLYEDTVGVPALTSVGGVPTLNIGTALATARTGYGWRGRNSSGESELVQGDTTQALMVSRLLELWAEQSGEYVGVDKDGEFYSQPETTFPQWIIKPAPGDVELSSSNSETYNMYLGRYRTAGGYENAYSASILALDEVVSCGIVDLTQRGIITGFEATAILTTILSRTADRPTWTNSLTLSSAQIRTTGDEPAPLVSVKGGDVVRIVGLSAAQQAEVGATHLDVTLASVVHPEERDQIILEPVGALPMSVEAALEAVA